jgi:hypothetical protein
LVSIGFASAFSSPPSAAVQRARSLTTPTSYGLEPNQESIGHVVNEDRDNVTHRSAEPPSATGPRQAGRTHNPPRELRGGAA